MYFFFQDGVGRIRRFPRFTVHGAPSKCFILPRFTVHVLPWSVGPPPAPTVYRAPSTERDSLRFRGSNAGTCDGHNGAPGISAATSGAPPSPHPQDGAPMRAVHGAPCYGLTSAFAAFHGPRCAVQFPHVPAFHGSRFAVGRRSVSCPDGVPCAVHRTRFW